MDAQHPLENMKKHLFSLILIALVALSGCVSGPLERKPYAQPLPQFDTIRMVRTACYGTCPIYEVEIQAGGQVKYRGEEFVKLKGVHESEMAPADIELLSNALRQVNFSELQQSYQFEEDGCVNLPTDFPAVSFLVTRDGNTKRVAFYYGCQGPNVPSNALAWLSRTIDELAKTDKLVDH